MEININVDVNVEKEIENVALTAIIESVSEVFLVPKRELLNHQRPAYLTQARFAVYYLGWLITKRSLPSIGRFMDRDHTTILHGRNRAIEIMRNNKQYKQKIELARDIAFEIQRKKMQDVKKISDEIKRTVIERTIAANNVGDSVVARANALEAESDERGIQADTTGGDTKRQSRVEKV